MQPVCLHIIFLLFTLHNLIIWIKINLFILLQKSSIEKALLTLNVTIGTRFFTLEKPEKIMLGLVKMYVLTFLLENIFIRLGTKLYRQVVGIPMGTIL